VVGEQGGLGIFDLIMSGSCLYVGVVECRENCAMTESKAEMVDWNRSEEYKAQVRALMIMYNTASRIWTR
jgi:hypothetical protein